MTIYSVSGSNDYHEDFYSLAPAKKAMKEHWPAKCTRIRIWANGDWEPCGEVTLKGSNKMFIANTKQKISNY